MSNLLRVLRSIRMQKRAFAWGALIVAAVSGIMAGVLHSRYEAMYFGMGFTLLALLTAQTAVCGSVMQNGAFRNFPAAGYRKSQIFCSFLLDALFWAIPAAVLFVLPYALLSAKDYRLLDRAVVMQGLCALGLMLVFAVLLCTVLMLLMQQTAPALMVCIGCVGALLIAGYSVRELIGSGTYRHIKPNQAQHVLQIGEEPAPREPEELVRIDDLQSPLREPVIVLHQLNPFVPVYDFSLYTYDPDFMEKLAADPAWATRRPWAVYALEWEALMLDGAPRCQIGMLLLVSCAGLLRFRKRDIK